MFSGFLGEGLSYIFVCNSIVYLLICARLVNGFIIAGLTSVVLTILITSGILSETGTLLGGVIWCFLKMVEAPKPAGKQHLNSNWIKVCCLVSANFGQTSVAQDGFEVCLDTSSVAIGAIFEGVFANEDVLSVTASKPLVVDSGQMTFDVPVARVAVHEGVSSNSVVRDSFTTNFDNLSSPIQISIGYKAPMKRGSVFGLGLTGKAHSGQTDLAANIGITLNF